MRVVIDTNVVVSAALKDRDSASILEEYKEVLTRPKFGLPLVLSN
jgi:predicted nucleic acid-binding protein